MHDDAGTSEQPIAAEAAAYPERLSTTQRKQQGVWFTPMALALPTARRCLAPLLGAVDPTALRIVDPAVGGGTFLLAALRVLVASGATAAHAVRCLHGIDVDATAATLAAGALAEASGVAELPGQVRAGDGLLELQPESFDAVLTNPPWETLQSGDAAKERVALLRPHFEHQGRGKLQTYRLFVERAFQLLRPGGRMGLIVPASLWFDRDAEPLRRLLLDRCDWQWLFGFENRHKVFAIDRRYRFGALVLQKGGPTRTVRVAFGRTDLAEWTSESPPHTPYQREELRQLSPHSGAFVEVNDRADLDLLCRMHEHGQPLLGHNGAFVWRQGDYNMTADFAQFVLCADAVSNGYLRGDDAVWRCTGKPDLLPLYQGAMIHDLHPNAAVHAGGIGHKTSWQAPASPAQLGPAYLVAAQPWRATVLQRSRARIAIRALSNATNERTTLACLLPDVPCGNSLGVFEPRVHSRMPLRELAAGAAVLGSLAFDWALRLRLGGTNLNGFVLTDCVLPRLDDAAAIELAQLALRLCAILPWHDALWQTAIAEGWADAPGPARTVDERAVLHTRIDVLVGRAYGLGAREVAWIVRGCELPVDQLQRFRTPPELAKGFWRVDRPLPPAARRPNRWLAAVLRDR